MMLSKCIKYSLKENYPIDKIDSILGKHLINFKIEPSIVSTKMKLETATIIYTYANSLSTVTCYKSIGTLIDYVFNIMSRESNIGCENLINSLKRNLV